MYINIVAIIVILIDERFIALTEVILEILYAKTGVSGKCDYLIINCIYFSVVTGSSMHLV